MTSTQNRREELGIPLRPRSAWGRALWRLGRRPLERLLGLHRLQQVYDRTSPEVGGLAWIDQVLDALETPLRVAAADLERIPAAGPVVVVANHPFGGAEGLALAQLVGRRRRDVRLMANYMLGRIAELREISILVDPFETTESVRSNLGAMREALGWLRQGGVLLVFPAGEVAHYDRRTGRIEDPPWNPAAARLVRRTQAPVVPVFFEGRNRTRFQIAGLIHPRLRTAMLPGELTARRGRPIRAHVGRPIAWHRLSAHADDAALTDYLRSRCYILSRRAAPGALRARPVQPRTTPQRLAPVVAAVPQDELGAEIAGLDRETHLLVDGEDQVVYIASAGRIPATLREIGRLRETTFREVGEGTGRETDLDRFDASYLHLFIWSRVKREVVGAYRLGCSDLLLDAGGIDALYTASLFRFNRSLFDAMGPALEMGRSFIRPEYQRSFTGLLLLWKGIGEFVCRNPRYATLFGPVSISADYQSASQRLIVKFLEQNRYAHDWSRWVRAKSPTRPERGRAYRPSPAHLRNLDDVSAFISEIEADQKGVPILLKQYLKLGGRLLGFNVDPEFSDVLDVLIMVDLRKTQPKVLRRYMGRENARAFLEHHAAAESSAGRSA